MNSADFLVEVDKARAILERAADYIALRGRGHELVGGATLTCASEVPWQLQVRCSRCAGIFWFDNLAWRVGGTRSLEAERRFPRSRHGRMCRGQRHCGPYSCFDNEEAFTTECTIDRKAQAGAVLWGRTSERRCAADGRCCGRGLWEGGGLDDSLDLLMTV
jgi:hypothetical protein